MTPAACANASPVRNAGPKSHRIRHHERHDARSQGRLLMRSYPVNSPQAAARVVALTVVADGDIGDTEIEWLDRLAVHEQLGLARHELHALQIGRAACRERGEIS